MNPQCYNAAIYCRLSKDDGTADESSSINTQREMLTKYVREQGWILVDVYIDDGYSGTNFERPDFKRMLADIESGRINLVITKDLSRLGRNYLETGAYIEVYFPQKGVRYIALNDGVDTEETANIDITPFKNILNEMYAKDISRKVKSARRTIFLNGNYLGSNAPYGYKKSAEIKNRLIPDEQTAPTIRYIFELARKGYGICRIRDRLRNERIPRPAAVLKMQGRNVAYKGEDYLWSNNSVRGILRNPVYIGNLAGYKRPAVSYRYNSKRPVRQPQDWVIVENTHEPIVDKDTFDLVQRMITERRSPKGDFDNIFLGIAKCADCGYAMRTFKAHRAPRANPLENRTYYCSNYSVYGLTACTSHLIEATDLHRVVLEDIKKHARLAARAEKELLKKITAKTAGIHEPSVHDVERELKKAEKRLSDLDTYFAKLYEDKLADKITTIPLWCSAMKANRITWLKRLSG